MPIHSLRLLLHHRAVRALLAAGDDVECHLVGGVLRDRALGLPSHDIDVVVSSRGKEIAGRLAEALPARFVLLGGKEFASYRLVGEDLVVDIWDRAGTSLHQDLARRDFTVNAIALDARTAEVVDPFGGTGDLQRRVLRATTADSFTGDPLRVLRLARLLLQLPGFSADPDTLGLARQASHRLSEIAAERVRDELTLLFNHPEAARGLTLLIALDLYPGLWLGRPGEAGKIGTALSELEALPACVRELREIDRALAGAVDPRIARLASLFAALPLPPAAVPLESLQRFRDAGYVTRQTAADVALLLDLALPTDEVGRRRFLHRAGRLWPTAICALGARTAARDGGLARWRGALRLLVDLARREGGTLLDPPRLVTGADVQELLGIPPGREVGRVLDAVRQAQVDGRVRSREEAVEMVRSSGRSPSSAPPRHPRP